MPSKYKGREQDEIPGVGRYNVEKLPINKPPQYKIGTGTRQEVTN